MSKKIIAVDVDDVLSAYAPSLIKFSNERWGTNLTINEIDENWAKMWQIDSNEMETRAQVLHKELFRDLDYIDNAKIILEKLAKNYDLVVTTSRRKSLAEHTSDWLDEHFPKIFSNIHHAGIYDEIHIESTFKKTKLDLCKRIGADYMIDDQPKHCFATSQAGITSLLFGDYPWNRTDQLPSGVVRVKNWHEVGKYFDSPT